MSQVEALQADEVANRLLADLSVLQSQSADAAGNWHEWLSADDQESLYALAHQLYSASRFQEARRVFQVLMRLSSADVRYARGMASCLHMLGDVRRALEFYAVASVLDPTDCEVLVQMATCCLGVGRITEAKDLLDYGCAQAQAKLRTEGGVRAAAHLEQMRAMLTLLNTAATQAATS